MPQDLPELRDRLELLGLREPVAQLVIPVPRVPVDPPGQRVRLGLEVATRVLPVQLARLVQQARGDQRDRQARTRLSPDPRAPVEKLGPPELTLPLPGLPVPEVPRVRREPAELQGRRDPRGPAARLSR